MIKFDPTANATGPLGCPLVAAVPFTVNDSDPYRAVAVTFTDVTL